MVDVNDPIAPRSSVYGTLRHLTMDGAMDCPRCSETMDDATERWGTFAEARGAEYLAAYVTIWHCPACTTLAGADDDRIEWVIEGDKASAER